MSLNGDATKIPIASDEDVVPARARGRAMAGEIGFSRTDSTLIATAISEVARNILTHAGCGEIMLAPSVDDRRCGLMVEARDSGPGIPDVDAALREGYGTGDGLGLGLPGVSRIMDEFEIETAVGRGTRVQMTKWCESNGLERTRTAFPTR